MFDLPLAPLRQVHVRPARERRVAVPRRLAVAHEHEFAGFGRSQEVSSPGDREALLPVPFEELVSIIFREGVLLVQKRCRPSEDVVDLEGLGGGYEQKGSGGMHGVLGCGVGGWRSRSKAILGEPTWLSAVQRDAYARVRRYGPRFA